MNASEFSNEPPLASGAFASSTPGSYAGTIEQWCRDFLRAPSPTDKFAAWAALPPARDWVWATDPLPERLSQPERPHPWQVVERSPKTPKLGALRHAAQRVHLLHTLAHHELQAAELFAWAVLAYPDTPRSFRQGLMRIVGEELRHLDLYRDHLVHLGAAYPSQPVRDWFWSRTVQCQAPIDFVAFMGLGLEGANLEHSARFAQAFREGGDELGAEALEQVERDEVGHVAFARKWFETWTGQPLRFEDWEARLPAPLTAAVFRALPLNRTARRSAGLSEEFLDELERAQPAHRPRSPKESGSHRTRTAHSADALSPSTLAWTPEFIMDPGRPPVVWILNLDVEEEWLQTSKAWDDAAAEAPYQRSPHMERILALKREPLLTQLVQRGDWVWPDTGKPMAPRGTPAIAWSPSRAAANEAQAHGWPLLGAVPDAVLRQVNHKRFLVPLLEASGAQLPKTICADRRNLQEWLDREALQDALLRRPFGAAGRQRMRMRAGAIHATQEAWLDARLAEGPLIAEPFVSIVWECSTCGWVSPGQEVRTFGARLQNTDATGAWQSAGALLSEDKQAAFGPTIENAALAVGQAMAATGYHGPFSLDAFVYRRSDGTQALQPMSDANARFTMAWAAAFREFLGNRLPT